MRKLSLLFLLQSVLVLAQVPQKMSYQSAVRNSTNQPVVNQNIGVKISISGAFGAVVYSETHSVSTNDNGVFSLEVGGGTPVSGVFADINWGNASNYIQSQVDLTGGTNYTLSVTKELLSVPYALYAGTTANATNGLSNGTTKNQIMYWNGTRWTTLNPGTQGQVLTICYGELIWTTGGICPSIPASITALNCSSAVNNGDLIAGWKADSVNSVISYTGGNGSSTTLQYPAQTINSTGVTGLTASLNAGNLANGNGTLTYTITGTPATVGTANFVLNIGGQTCTLSRTVTTYPVGITATTCGASNVLNSTVGYGSMTDQEGNVYKTLKIGTQVWMAENLRTTKYNDGRALSEGTGAPIYSIGTFGTTYTGAYSSYNNNTSNDCAYGKLYNTYALTRSLCPPGWHVPTEAEWTTLITFLGGEAIAGGKMKSTGTQYWTSPNTDATNSCGFSALPGGEKQETGVYAMLGSKGNWWCGTGLKYYTFDYNSGALVKNQFSSTMTVTNIIGSGTTTTALTYPTTGFSVRLVKD